MRTSRYTKCRGLPNIAAEGSRERGSAPISHIFHVRSESTVGVGVASQWREGSDCRMYLHTSLVRLSTRTYSFGILTDRRDFKSSKLNAMGGTYDAILHSYDCQRPRKEYGFESREEKSKERNPTCDRDCRCGSCYLHRSDRNYLEIAQLEGVSL